MPISHQRSASASWASAARQDPLWKHPKEQEAITIVQRLIEGEFAPEKAAEELASVYDPWLKKGKARTWELWKLIIEAIVVFGDTFENIQRLVLMMQSLALRPYVRDDSGTVITQDSDSYKLYWRDLPSFPMQLREDSFGILNFRPAMETINCIG